MNLKRYLLLVALLLGSRSAVLAQSPAGEISGWVKDPSGAVMAGVVLTAHHVESGVTFTAKTDRTGRYEFVRLPQGRFRIKASYLGFRSSEEQTVAVNAGKAVSLGLVLHVQGVEQSMTVTGEAASLDLSSPNTSSLVNQISMTSLPINGRSLEQLTLLTPGIVPIRAKDNRSPNGFTESISGGGSRGATFLLDGLDIQHALFASDTPGGVSGLLLGMEAVQEFEVLPDAYPAYIAGGGGPVVNVVSRRGTRQLHGSLYEYYRDDRLDARNFFDNPKPPFSRHQFGTWIGGPLPGRAATVFASYEGLRERLGRTLFATVPDEQARAGRLPSGPVVLAPAIQPILNRYPLPNGENFGDGTAAYSYRQVQPTDDHHLNVRTDFELSSHDALWARYTMQDSSRVTPIEEHLQGFDSALDARNHYLSVEERHVFSSRWINTFQFGYNQSGYDTRSVARADLAAIDPLIPGRRNFGRLNIRGLSSFGTDTADLSSGMKQVELTNSVRFSSGRHDWTFGANFKRYHSDGTYDFFFDGLLIYENLRSFLTNQPDRFTGAEPGSDTRRRYRQNLLGLYVHDQFRWTPTLTVSYGLRHDSFTVPREADGKVSNLRLRNDPAPTVGDPLFENPSWRNLAPRVGLAWNAGGTDRTVVRAGFGTYYDPIRENIFGYGARIQTPFVTVRTVTRPPYPNPFDGTRQGPPRLDPVQFDLQTPYMMRYHTTLQRALTRNLDFRVGYVGSRGVHLPRVGDINVPTPLRVEADGRLFFGTTRAIRPNPNFDRVRYTSTDANSFYNSLQVGLSQRWNRAVQFDANYSYSRSIDDASGYRRSFTNSVADVPPYYDDRTMERGLSNFHIAHHAVFSYTWDLPFGRGSGGLASVLLRNWRTSGILTLSSGYPFTVNVSFDAANNGVREGHRPDLAAGASNNPVLGGPNRYFDVAAFGLQEPGYVGNLGRNTLIGPGYAALDLMLMRKVPFFSGHALEMRLEAFNVLNRANFAAPQNNGTGGVILFNDTSGVPVGNAARIFSTVGTSRQLQLGLRWTF